MCFETLVSEIPFSSSKNRKWQVLTFVGLKLLEEGRDNTTKKGSKQGGPRGRGPGPVEVRTTLESTLFDIDLTVNKVSLCILLFYI